MAKNVYLNIKSLKRGLTTFVLAGGMVTALNSCTPKENPNVAEELPVINIESDVLVTNDEVENKTIIGTAATIDKDDFISDLSVKMANYNTNPVNINKVDIINFVYNPDKQNEFYDIRMDYSTKIKNTDDTITANKIYDEGKGKLENISKESLTEYQAAYNYYQEHENEIKDVYNKYEGFDFYRGEPHDDLSDLENFGGLYQAGDYCVLVNPYRMEIINPETGYTIRISPEFTNNNRSIPVLERGEFTMYGPEYTKNYLARLESEGIPSVSYEELKEHGCFANILGK